MGVIPLEHASTLLVWYVYVLSVLYEVSDEHHVFKKVPVRRGFGSKSSRLLFLLQFPHKSMPEDLPALLHFIHCTVLS